MKSVIFVRVKSKVNGYGVRGIKCTFDDVEDIIKEKIEEGYNYSGFVPIVYRGNGDMQQMDLIFIKE